MEIEVGTLAQPLHEQLRVAPESVKHHQRDLDALNRLRIRGIIPPAIAWKGVEKVLENLSKDVPV